MRHADDSAFEHAWLGIQHQFDFFGVDVVSAGNDQIFVAPQNVDVAVFVDLPQIASNEEPVASQLGRGFLGHLPIALEYVWSANFNLSHSILGQSSASFGVSYLHLHPWKRKSDRARAPLTIIGI